MAGLIGDIMTTFAFNFVSILILCIIIFTICCGVYKFLNPDE